MLVARAAFDIMIGIFLGAAIVAAALIALAPIILIGAALSVR